MRDMAKEANQMPFAVAVLGGGDATIFGRVLQRKKHLSWDQLMEYTAVVRTLSLPVQGKGGAHYKDGPLN